MMVSVDEQKKFVKRIDIESKFVCHLVLYFSKIGALTAKDIEIINIQMTNAYEKLYSEETPFQIFKKYLRRISTPNVPLIEIVNKKLR